jgi:hypothetical protein
MQKRALASAVLLFGLALAGCDSFDPLDKFQDWDLMSSSKTPLKGERRPVFESGVPGVPQGVPPELVKGYQPPAEEPPPVVTAKPAKSAKPKKATAKPRRPPPQQTQQDEPPPQQRQMRQAPAARTTTQAPPGNSDAWPTMPGAQPTWPSDAQPAPSR